MRSFTRDTLINQIKEHYYAQGMLLIAAGAVAHDQMLALGEKYFAKLQSGAPGKIEAARYAGGEFRAEDDLEQAHLTLAFPVSARTTTTSSRSKSIRPSWAAACPRACSRRRARNADSATPCTRSVQATATPV
ncbi:MAG: insulinase family protein [Rhodopseudomonas palustris]|nr:insulinase family protein [Rhodopseudomonas palustris]